MLRFCGFLLFLLASAHGVSLDAIQRELQLRGHQLFLLLDHGPVDGHIQEQEMTHVFAHYDVNGDGVLTTAEFLQKAHGRHAAAVFDNLDRNHNQEIKKSDIPLIHAEFDANGDGILTQSEFMSGYMQLMDTVWGIPH